MYEPTPEDKERFFSRVDVREDPDDCWLWTAGTHTKGYGRLRWGGEAENAHRVAWMIAKGEIPEGKQVVQTCGHLRCCNPLHLELGPSRARPKSPETISALPVIERLRRQVATLQAENDRLNELVKQPVQGGF